MKNHEKYRMTYTIGTNFDPELIEYIAENDQYNQIKSVYGKLNNDYYGGGRGASIIPNLSFKNFKKYVEKCRSNNIEFNYLFNALCNDNSEILKKENNKILKYINKISEIGINRITLTSPYLCELIKRKFPHFIISLGAYAGVYSLQLVKYWEEMGVSEITLSSSLIRNFFILELILNHTKKTGTNIRIIANGNCVHDCPNTAYHGTSSTHAAQKNHKSKNNFIDYCFLNCNYEKVKNPMKFIASSWIRPEDIKHYEYLCEKTGNYNFTIKLLERTSSTEFLKRVVKAYLSSSYDGNLLDILNWPGSRNVKKKTKLIEIIKTALLYQKDNFDKYTYFFRKLPKINIDNKKMDGFINKFIESNDCYLKICSENNCEQDISNKNVCSFCEKWMEKTVTFDQEERGMWLENAEQLFQSLNNGKIFK